MEATRTLIMTTGSNGAPLFATPETAEATAAAIRALGAARTWGQFFKALPPHITDWVRGGFEDVQPIVAALREAGFTVFERPELVLEVP